MLLSKRLVREPHPAHLSRQHLYSSMEALHVLHCLIAVFPHVRAGTACWLETMETSYRYHDFGL